MRLAGRRRTRVIVGFLAIVVTVALLVVRLGRVSRNGRRELVVFSRSSSPDHTVSAPSTSPSPAANAGAPGQSPTFQSSPPLPISGSQSPESSPPAVGEGTAPNNLIIPVAGVRSDQLRDTYSES